MTDLNQYLRRADVEALLDAKIEALDETARQSVGSTGGKALAALRHRIDEARAKSDALRTVREQLGLCQQFTNRTSTITTDPAPGVTP